MQKAQVKVGIVQQSCKLKRLLNYQKSEQGIEACVRQGAELVILQELHSYPYFCQSENPQHFELAEQLNGETQQYFAQIAKKLHVVLVISIFEKRAKGLYHNTAIVIEKDGCMAGFYRKMHIPDDPSYYEKYYFTPGDLGFLPISTSIGKLGVMVCFDQWFPEAARLMALAGADILIYPTAIGWDKQDSKDEQTRQLNAWIRVQQGHSIANALPLVAVNRVGLECDTSGSSIHFWGNSFILGCQGEVLAQAPEHEHTLVAEVNYAHIEKTRQIWTFFRDRRIDAYQDITKRYND